MATTTRKPKRKLERHPNGVMFRHSNGQWACRFKIAGKWRMFYFGRDTAEAERRYNLENADLRAGKLPDRSADVDPEAVCVRHLMNRFLEHKQQRRKAGKLAAITFQNYKETCDRVTAKIPLSLPLSKLTAQHIAEWRDTLDEYSPSVILAHTARFACVLNFGYRRGMMSDPIRLKAALDKPSKKEHRLHRAKKGNMAFSAAECRQLLETLDTYGTKRVRMMLRAMTMLALNGAFGNEDLAKLKLADLDLENGVIAYARPKTGMERRCPLWVETIAALRAWLEIRCSASQYVFLRVRSGKPLCGRRGDVSDLFRPSLEAAGIYKTNRTFYSLRRTHRTISDRCNDQRAAALVMGHATDADMGGTYVQSIDDDRLLAVVNAVREWLLAE